MNTINLNFNEKGKELFKEGSCFKLKDSDKVLMLSKVRIIKDSFSYLVEEYYTLINLKTGRDFIICRAYNNYMSLRDINEFIIKLDLIPLGDNLIFNIKKKDDE